ncbi:hypothetical protein OU5_P0326 (plasmid) [Pseudomonas mandelii JR-1]|uniref:Uncharacterized protein n=1 Tax=Pseudomonas mandelii JR-1 TaxID=1147786 RepID=A0A024EMG5_9PSED|nr:hypothetical protein OU5_P0326 [Pseudomonas mandelii JR-1]
MRLIAEKMSRFYFAKGIPQQAIKAHGPKRTPLMLACSLVIEFTQHLFHLEGP